ncbi:hypothetical protein EVG20_g9637, partial [Dentipellis fragilis]
MPIPCMPIPIPICCILPIPIIPSAIPPSHIPPAPAPSIYCPPCPWSPPIHPMFCTGTCICSNAPKFPPCMPIMFPIPLNPAILPILPMLPMLVHGVHTVHVAHAPHAVHVVHPDPDPDTNVPAPIHHAHPVHPANAHPHAHHRLLRHHLILCALKSATTNIAATASFHPHPARPIFMTIGPPCIAEDPDPMPAFAFALAFADPPRTGDFGRSASISVYEGRVRWADARWTDADADAETKGSVAARRQGD